IIVPLGFYTKFYSGPYSGWVNNSLGGVFYVVFWSLVVFLFVPKLNSFKIGLLVFVATCLLEFLQLWHPAFLEFIRSYFIGRSILGTTFSPPDFLYYFAGFILSVLTLHLLNRIENKMADQSTN
ncbi:MAG: DUF2809 domain-containing protein, partial [Calditrichaceae bacterium]